MQHKSYLNTGNAKVFKKNFFLAKNRHVVVGVRSNTNR